MQIPLSWLKVYVDIALSPDELAQALTMSGLEAANLGSPIPAIPGLITARIEKIERHPNADKLTVCQVRPAEQGEALTVVCGAPNIKEGDVVPLATVGVKLPDGTVIKKSAIRGVTSMGMMCSQRELGVSDDHTGIWILPPDTPLGKPLAEALGRDDAIIEVEPTPNRGDLLCVIGVAREIAAITGRKARLPELKLPETGAPIADCARVDIEDYDGCPRYVARLVRGVTIGPSPAWMVARLEACGMRAINNVVDVTNYVMLELGQPLHAFDFNSLRGKRIVVRRAQADEKFVTLDCQERALRDDTLMICDGEGPVAVAGVMGGLDSEVSGYTRDVLIESAYFKPTGIRRTARLLNIPTEASRRFDKGVDRMGALFAADRAALLMHELAGAEICSGAIDARRDELVKTRLTLRPARTEQILGIPLPIQKQLETLSRLDGMEVEEKDGALAVAAPSYRPDLTREIDLIEEIARLVGYDNIPATRPRFHMEPLRRSRGLELAKKIRERFCALGFAEVVLTNFEDPKRLAALRLSPEDARRRAVKLANPLSENESVLRTTLVPKLLACLHQNRSRGATSAVRLYEINAAFEALGEELPRQRTLLAGLIAPELEKQLWPLHCPEDGFYDIKGVVEQVLAAVGFPGSRIERDPAPENFLHPGKCARVMVGAAVAGRLGELRPDLTADLDIKNPVFLFELQFDMLAESASYVGKAKPVSKFPPALRDIAMVVDEAVTMQEIVEAARKLKSPLLEELALFDVFRGGAVPAGKKSLAFHVIYQSRERTLTDEEISAEHRRLADQLGRMAGAALR